MIEKILLCCLIITAMLTGVGRCAVAPLPVASIADDTALEGAFYRQLLLRNTDFQFTWAGDQEEIVDGDWLLDIFERVYEQDQATSDDFDYLLYSVKDYELARSISGSTAVFNLRIAYLESPEQLYEVNKMVNKALSTLKMDNDSLPVKVRKIHDFIIRKVKYDSGTSKESAYAAIVTGQANSRGYALLAYKMLTEAGVACRIVQGTVAGDAAFWNMVQLDGRWYYIDLARDDGNSEIVPVRYTYFLRGSTVMKKDHYLAEEYQMVEFETNHPADGGDYRGRNELILQADAMAISDKAGIGPFNELYEKVSNNTVDPFEKFNDAMADNVLDALEGVFSGV